MPGTRELTRRIKSVKSTRKITRAMQLISAAKMRKSQMATLASRTYTKLAWELIQSLGSQAAIESPLTRTFPEAKKVGIVIISSNRGQVGGFNNNLFKKIRQFEEAEPELISDVVVLGKKARENSLRLKRNVLAEFEKLDTTIPVEQIYPLVTLLTDAYKSEKYSKILIVYNHFASTLVQVPTIKTLLPFSTEQLAEAENTASTTPSEAIFEPSPKEVAEHLLPRILESQIYQAILESDASEHSARMVMMKNATESAGDLIDDLTLTFNSLRQSKITTELSEITAGRIALEK
jgi:F-type H+-transporting ATPase subunit gamma